MIIGLCGPKGAGKSELARLLQARHGFERIAFADGIKHMLQALYEYQGLRNGRAKRMLWGDLKEEPTPLLNGKTTRWAMQTLGTEWGRNCIHPDLWRSIWTRKVRGKKNVVAEDLRFFNEAQAVWDLNGKVIRVDRTGLLLDDHISEMEYMRIQVNWQIINDGTAEEMLKKVEQILFTVPA